MAELGRRRCSRSCWTRIGVASIEELFAQIPADHIGSTRPLDLPPRSALGGRALAPPARHAGARTRPARRTSASSAAAAGSTTFPPSATRSSARTEFLTPGLGHAVLRPRPQPGLVRVLQPARRAARAGLRRPAGLQLGLRGRPRDPDGVADHRPARGARSALDRPGAPRRDPHLLRAARDGEPHRRRRVVDFDPRHGRLDLAELESASSRTRPRRSTSRTRRYLGVIEADAARDRRARPRARRRGDRRGRSDLARRARPARPTTAPTSSSARCSRSACT